MPCGGLTPFLLHYRKSSPRGGLLVSMPCGGLTPFLLKYHLDYVSGKTDVSMPCGGLTPFLLVVTDMLDQVTVLCQCPVAGLLHFYT